MIKAILYNVQIWMWKRKYRPNQIVTHFIARDVRRDVQVIDVEEITKGIITVRTKTWNVLYAIKGIAEEPQFGEIRRIEIKHLWNWSGALWGGPVPNSIDSNKIEATTPPE